MEFVSSDHFLVQAALFDGETRYVRDVDGRLVDLHREGRRRDLERHAKRARDFSPGRSLTVVDPSVE